MERVPPFRCHLTHIHHGLWVISIDVEDGSIDDSSHICGVRRGARHPGVSGEADLCER